MKLFRVRFQQVDDDYIVGEQTVEAESSEEAVAIAVENDRLNPHEAFGPWELLDVKELE